MKTKFLFAMLSMVFGSIAVAMPVEIDTPQYHLIVVRPIDQYGKGDAQLNQKLFELHESKQYAINRGVYSPNETPKFKYFQQNSDDPVSASLKDVAMKLGFTPSDSSNSDSRPFLTSIGSPDPAKQNHFAKVTTESWRKEVLSLGNPDTFQERLSSQKTGKAISDVAKGVGGAIVGTAVGLVGGHFLGDAIGGQAGAVIANGGAATLGGQSGLTAFSSTPEATLGKISKIPMPDIDYSKFKSIEAYRGSVGKPDESRNGLIYIGYKVDKDEALSQKALLQALPIYLGLDETLDQIKANQAEDFALRKKMWAECVASHQCSD